MNTRIQRLLVWWLPLIALATFTFFIQTHLYLHKDVAYLLHEAGLMLQGQTYGNQIFEPNPPLILFLSMPPLLLSKLTSIDVIYTMSFYVILLSLLSTILSYFLIQKIFLQKNLALFISYTVAFTLLILPAHQFGQREHFLMICIFPYLFATGLFLENKKITPGFATLIGVMAAIGFCIKPHFLFSLAFIELYVCFKKRSLLGWIRIESVLIISGLLLYATIIWVFFKSYLEVVYPLWWPYYQVLAHPLKTILIYPSLIFLIAALLFYCFIQKIDHYSSVSRVFFLATIGFIMTFMLPRVNWYYHILPAISAASILLAITLGQLIARHTFLSFVASFLLAFPFLQSGLFLYDSLAFYASDNTWSQLIQFMKQSSPNNSYDYFSNTHSLIILEDYAHANYVGQFPSLWWMYDYAFLKFKPSEKATKYAEQQFPQFANAIATDLKNKKPQFVIIDVDSENEKYYGKKINYIEELSRSTIFKKTWRHYHSVKTIDEYAIYQLKS